MQQSFTFAGLDDVKPSPQANSDRRANKRQTANSHQSSSTRPSVPDWKLNKSTRSTGLAGVRAARQILQAQSGGQSHNTVAA